MSAKNSKIIIAELNAKILEQAEIIKKKDEELILRQRAQAEKDASWLAKGNALAAEVKKLNGTIEILKNEFYMQLAYPKDLWKGEKREIVGYYLDKFCGD